MSCLVANMRELLLFSYGEVKMFIMISCERYPVDPPSSIRKR